MQANLTGRFCGIAIIITGSSNAILDFVYNFRYVRSSGGIIDHYNIGTFM